MAELLILSDDFTGALDTGVQFAQRGIRTLVSSLGGSRRGGRPAGTGLAEPEVLVINTESRHVQAAEAARRIRDAVARWAGVGRLGGPDLRIYKKTDSLLRGNVGSELEALMEATSRSALAFVPAFPQTGRTTVRGVQYLEGVPIHKTVLASDRLNPITTSHVPSIAVRDTRGLETRLIEIDRVREGAFPPAAHFRTERRTVFVFDAQTDRDLARVASFLAQEDLLGLTAGCAGFAGALPDALELSTGNPEQATLAPPLLVLSGSTTDLSRRQLALAEKRGFRRKSLGLEEKLQPGIHQTPSGRRLIRALAHDLRQGRHCILTTGESDPAEEKRAAGRTGVPAARIPSVIARNLAHVTKGVLETLGVREPNGAGDVSRPHGLNTLVILGGDTTMALLEALDCGPLAPKQQILPGVPVSAIEHLGISLVTKSGGFGSEDVLLEIAELCGPAKSDRKGRR